MLSLEHGSIDEVQMRQRHEAQGPYQHFANSQLHHRESQVFQTIRTEAGSDHQAEVHVDGNDAGETKRELAPPKACDTRWFLSRYPTQGSVTGRQDEKRHNEQARDAVQEPVQDDVRELNLDASQQRVNQRQECGPCKLALPEIRRRRPRACARARTSPLVISPRYNCASIAIHTQKLINPSRQNRRRSPRQSRTPNGCAGASRAS